MLGTCTSCLLHLVTTRTGLSQIPLILSSLCSGWSGDSVGKGKLNLRFSAFEAPYSSSLHDHNGGLLLILFEVSWCMRTWYLDPKRLQTASLWAFLDHLDLLSQGSGCHTLLKAMKLASCKVHHCTGKACFSWCESSKFHPEILLGKILPFL